MSLADSIRLMMLAARSPACCEPTMGFSVSRDGARIKVADSAIDKLKAKIRELTRRTRGHRLSDIVQELKTALTEWKAYFGIAEVLSALREIDK